MAKQVDELLAKELSRKEFLLTIGLGITAAAGLSSFVNLFTNKQTGLRQVTSGYGSSSYGGYSSASKKNIKA